MPYETIIKIIRKCSRMLFNIHLCCNMNMSLCQVSHKFDYKKKPHFCVNMVRIMVYITQTERIIKIFNHLLREF